MNLTPTGSFIISSNDFPINSLSEVVNFPIVWIYYLIISAVKLDKSISTYDNLGYPLEIVSENNIFGVYDAKHLKSQLFYN